MAAIQQPESSLGTAMTRSLEGRSILITGGGAGIGRSTAMTLAQAGANICVTDIDLVAAEETAQLISQAGSRVIALRVDVTDESAVIDTVDRTVREFSRLDGAFNNAGIRGVVAGAHEMSLDDFLAVMRVNVISVFLCQREELRAMYRNGGGSIVNMSSILGQLASVGAVQYTTSKHAVIGLTRNAALEAAPRGVRVNAVAPGTIETPLNVALAGSMEAARDRWASAYPIGRLGQPQEIADVVSWLLGPHASFVTGQVIYAEGGMMLR